MKKYISKGIATRLTSGVLELTEDQARRRKHNLKAMEDGTYEIVFPVEFKNGETFGFDGEIPKSLADALIEKKIKAK